MDRITHSDKHSNAKSSMVHMERAAQQFPDVNDGWTVKKDFDPNPVAPTRKNNRGNESKIWK